ncbi:MAG: YegS/Rv2252/BmrU family lipid kinase [Chitinispirillaceae bacterium]
MREIEALVLAADQAGDLSNDAQITHSALVPLHGKPFLDWVVEALQESKYIKSIKIIGPDKVDELFSKRFITKRISPSTATLENIAGLFRNTDTQSSGHLITPCEAVFLTPGIIDRACELFMKSQADIAIPLISPRRLKCGFHRSATVEWENRKMIPGVFAFSRTSGMIPGAMHRLGQLNKEKDPLSDSGVIFPAVAAVEQSFIERNPSRIRYFELPYPQAAFSIRNRKDLQYAENILPNPWHPKFKKIRLVINPYSGAGLQLPDFLKKALGIRTRSLDVSKDKVNYTDTITGYLNEFGMYPEISETKSPLEATQTARFCSEHGYDLVIAAGGDGTINAVVNGLAGSRTALGVIPLGTVNVYAINLNIPMEIRSACQLIARGETRRIDLGKASDRFFTCLAGVGFDAYIVNQADKGLKKVMGAAAYILIGLKNLIRYRFAPIRLSIDDQPVIRSGFIVFIANGKYYSSNMTLSSNAKLDDGLLDVIIMKDRHLLSFLGYVWGFYKGDITDHANVDYFLGRHVKVFRQGRHYVHIDGEPFGRSPMDFRVVPQALTVVS